MIINWGNLTVITLKTSKSVTLFGEEQREKVNMELRVLTSRFDTKVTTYSDPCQFFRLRYDL